jgi:cystathionine beta-lyase
VFSFTFKESVSAEKAKSFIDALNIFKIGMSWGGVNSLAVIYPDLKRPNRDFGGRIVRLNIGLEDTDDLIVDLEQAMQGL